MSSITFSSSVEARLWFLTRSKLIDPFACRGLKSLKTPHDTGWGLHEMLDEPLDDARDVMFGEDEAPILGAYGDAMELDEADHLDLSQEHSLNGIAEGGDALSDADLFWEHSQDQGAHTCASVHDESNAETSGALAFESGNDVVC